MSLGRPQKHAFQKAKEVFHQSRKKPVFVKQPNAYFHVTKSFSDICPDIPFYPQMCYIQRQEELPRILHRVSRNFK